MRGKGSLYESSYCIYMGVTIGNRVETATAFVLQLAFLPSKWRCKLRWNAGCAGMQAHLTPVLAGCNAPSVSTPLMVSSGICICGGRGGAVIDDHLSPSSTGVILQATSLQSWETNCHMRIPSFVDSVIILPSASPPPTRARKSMACGDAPQGFQIQSAR